MGRNRPVLAYFFLYLLPTAVWAGVCHDLSSHLDKLRTQLQKLEKPWQLTVEGVSYTVDRILGQGSSVVCLTADSQHILKVYPLKYALGARYDKLAREFLKEKGVDVVEVLASGQTATLPADIRNLKEDLFAEGPANIVVTKYRKGLRYPEIEQAAQSAPGFDAFRAQKDLLELQGKLVGYFKTGEFRLWLQERDPELMQDPNVFRVSGLGDLWENHNYLYDPAKMKWFLIDP